MGPRLPRGSAVSGQQLSPTRGGRTLGTVPGTRTRCRLLETCLPLGIPSKPPVPRSRAASSPAPRRGGDESRAPARPSRPQQDVGSGERAARPAGAGRRAGAKPRVCAWDGRGRKGCKPGYLRAGSGEAHGQEHVQRRSILDGSGTLLAVPPRGDFAVQLFSRGHAKRGGVAVLSHGSEASHRRGRCSSRIVPEGGGSWTTVGQGAPGRKRGGRRRGGRRRRRASRVSRC